MFYILLLFFAEIYATISFGIAFGAGALFLEIIGSALLGMMLLSRFKNNLAQNISSLYKQEIDMNRFVSLNLFSLIGAILLIVPGVLTDVIGLLMQFELLAVAVAKLFIRQKPNAKDEIIDVEFSDKSSDERIHLTSNTIIEATVEEK
jgi:UPF0716 protein FxsA